MNREDIERAIKYAVTIEEEYELIKYITKLEQSIQTLTDQNNILEQQYKDDERTIKKLVAENKSLRCCSNCRYDCNMLIHGCCEKWVKE